jgi:hypothetical protein
MVASPSGVSISADVLLASDNDNPAVPKDCVRCASQSIRNRTLGV